MVAFANEIACVRWRSLETLHVRQQSTGRETRFELADYGGGAVISRTASGTADCVLSWAITQSEPAKLHLTETHVEGHRSSCKKTVSFSSTLLPKVSYHTEHGLVVLTADGSLHSLLPRDQSSHQSLLEGLTVSSTDLNGDIDRLGTPTALDVLKASRSQTEELICIGAQTGSLLVVPPTCLDGQTAVKPYELAHSPSGYRAFFSKSTTAAVTWTGSLEPFAPGVLCVLHEDCSLRFWNVGKRQRLLAENLLQQSGQKGLLVPAAVGSVCHARGHLRLVVHLEPKPGVQCQPQTVAVSMDIQILQEGSLQVVNMRERMLEHSDLRFQTVLMHTGSADVYPAQTWLLSSNPSLHSITSTVSGEPHAELCRATLIEKQGVNTGQKHQPLQEDIWERVQEAVQEQTGQPLADCALSQHFMQQLLAPGTLCQQALSQALQELGQPLPSQHASLEEAQHHLTAAAQASPFLCVVLQEIAASAQTSQLASWRRVVQTYWKHWTELHPPVGLVQLPQGGVAIVRLGHMLTFLQESSPLAPPQHGSSPSAGDTSLSSDLSLLMQCSELLQQLLGQDVLDLFVHLWTHPSPGLSAHNLCCAFTQVLATGPQPGSQHISQQAGGANRDALRQWRQQRSAAVLQLGNLISHMSHRTPVAALRSYIALTSQGSRQSLPGPTESDLKLTPTSGDALTIMLRQAASHELQAASLMLLLAWLHSLQAVGTLHISPAVSHVLKAEVVPELEAHFCSVAVTQWLCTVPATALTDNEAISAKHSRNTMKLASLDFVSGSGQQAQHQQSVAELLLPGFWQYSGGMQLQHSSHQAVSALAAYIQAGCSHESMLHPTPGSRLVQQALSIGHKLTQLHQMGHIPHLLALAGNAANTLGAAFLKGFAQLQQAHRSLVAEQQGEMVQEAVGHLFQASAVFYAADQPAGYGEQADLNASCNLVNLVVQNMLLALTGKYDRPAPQAAQLQYFEALMLQSEKWGWPQAAASFAQAAMRHIQVAYPTNDSHVSDQESATQVAERHERESKLCTNLFVYALEAGHYEDAYNAVQANPVAGSALGNLLRLVNTLVNTGNIATLCALPYAADFIVKQENGRHEVVSLLDATQQALEQRAATADVTSQPQPYDVLFDFYCMRSNFKAAATAQYALACRLSDARGRVQQWLHLRATALLQALTALSMVEPSQQWILNPGPLQEALSPAKPYSHQSPLSAPDQESAEAKAEAEATLSRCRAGLAQSTVIMPRSSSSSQTSGCQYTDLAKQHAAAHAHALLSHLDPEASQRATAGDDVFHRLLGLGLFHAALSLAVVLYEGQRLSHALQRSVATMVTSCVQKQVHDPLSVRPNLPASGVIFGQQLAASGLSQDQELRPDFEDLSPEAAWQSVLETTEQHDRGRHIHRLHLAAVQAALAKERRLKLPPALLAPFQASSAHEALLGMAGQGADPAALLTVYLRHDRLADAADLVISHLAAYQKASVVQKEGHCRVWFPFRIIIKLMARLQRNPGKFSSRHMQLQEALQKHLHSCAELSSTFLDQLDQEDVDGMEE